eukprot:Colp12_sorted_trinity150504_noHs@31266
MFIRDGVSPDEDVLSQMSVGSKIGSKTEVIDSEEEDDEESEYRRKFLEEDSDFQVVSSTPTQEAEPVFHTTSSYAAAKAAGAVGGTAATPSTGITASVADASVKVLESQLRQSQNEIAQLRNELDEKDNQLLDLRAELSAAREQLAASGAPPPVVSQDKKNQLKASAEMEKLKKDLEEQKKEYAMLMEKYKLFHTKQFKERPAMTNAEIEKLKEELNAQRREAHDLKQQYLRLFFSPRAPGDEKGPHPEPTAAAAPPKDVTKTGAANAVPVQVLPVPAKTGGTASFFGKKDTTVKVENKEVDFNQKAFEDFIAEHVALKTDFAERQFLLDSLSLENKQLKEKLGTQGEGYKKKIAELTETLTKYEVVVQCAISGMAKERERAKLAK